MSLNFNPASHLRFAGPPRPRQENVCYYFGTFNPVHNGHMAVAHAAVRQFGFDKVVFVPAFETPHKDAAHVASFSQRYEMLRRAVAGHPELEVSDIESRLPTPSYSANTIEALAKTDTRARLPFIIGVDALKGLPGWHHAKTLVDRLTFIVAPRDGDRAPASIKLDGVRHRLNRKKLEMNELGLSSTQVRNLVNGHHYIGDMVPAGVDAFIREENLYQDSE